MSDDGCGNEEDAESCGSGRAGDGNEKGCEDDDDDNAFLRVSCAETKKMRFGSS